MVGPVWSLDIFLSFFEDWDDTLFSGAYHSDWYVVPKYNEIFIVALDIVFILIHRHICKILLYESVSHSNSVVHKLWFLRNSSGGGYEKDFGIS